MFMGEHMSFTEDRAKSIEKSTGDEGNTAS